SSGGTYRVNLNKEVVESGLIENWSFNGHRSTPVPYASKLRLCLSPCYCIFSVLWNHFDLQVTFWIVEESLTSKLSTFSQDRDFIAVLLEKDSVRYLPEVLISIFIKEPSVDKYRISRSSHYEGLKRNKEASLLSSEIGGRRLVPSVR